MKKLSLTVTLLAASIANADCNIHQIGDVLKSKIKHELLAAAQKDQDHDAVERIQEELEFSDFKYDPKTSSFKLIAGYNPIEFGDDHEVPGTMNGYWFTNRIEQQGAAPLAGVTYTVVTSSSSTACSYVFTTNQKMVRFLGSKTKPENWLGLSSIIPFRVPALETFTLRATK